MKQIFIPAPLPEDRRDPACYYSLESLTYGAWGSHDGTIKTLAKVTDSVYGLWRRRRGIGYTHPASDMRRHQKISHECIRNF